MRSLPPLPLAQTRRRVQQSLCMTAALLFAPLPDVDDSTRQQRATHQRVVGLVGHWSDTTVGGPAVVVNGERWSGTTPVERLRALSEPLLGPADSTMIAHWTAPSAYPIAVAPAVGTFRDGTLRVQFNLLGGQSDQIAGIVFGLRANGEYYYLRYNTRDGNLALWHYVNGARVRVQSGAGERQLPLNAWHELVVSIRGTEVRGTLVGDSTLTVVHTLAQPPIGFTGLWAKRDAVTMFRGFAAEAAK